jgi:hypothetical protein
MPTAPAAPSLNLPAASLQAPRRSPSNLVLYVCLGAAFLIALFLVIFFAMRG